MDPDVLNSLSAAGLNEAMIAAAAYTMICFGVSLFLVGVLGLYEAWGKGPEWIIYLVRFVTVNTAGTLIISTFCYFYMNFAV